MASATSGCQVEEAGQGNGYRKEFRHFNAAYPIARAPRTRPSSPGQTLDRSSQAVPHIRNAHLHRTRSNPLRNIHSSVAFEHQFGQDSLPFIAPEEMVVVLVPVLFAPAQDGSDLAAQGRGPFGRDEGAGKAGERAPLRVMHLPTLAVVEQGDGIARPSADKLAAFYADMVNSDGFLPANTISNTIRDAMLSRGLVTPERLRARGVH